MRAPDQAIAEGVFTAGCDLVIPDGRTFADLRLRREPGTRQVCVDPVPLVELCCLNGLDWQMTLLDSTLLCQLICRWYYLHRRAGGDPDPVFEHLLTESHPAHPASDVGYPVRSTLH